MTATALRMVADSNSNDEGQIGESDTATTPLDETDNAEAIDTDVSTVAASSADGI